MYELLYTPKLTVLIHDRISDVLRRVLTLNHIIHSRAFAIMRSVHGTNYITMPNAKQGASILWSMG